jgi:hypothetical protein
MELDRSLLFILIVIAGLLLVPVCSSGDELIISSRPEGSSVELSGPVQVSGAAPFEFPSAQSGRFRVTLSRPGFERSVGWVDFSRLRPDAPLRAQPAVYFPNVALTLAGLAGPSKFLRGEGQKAIILSVAQGAAALAASIEELRGRDFRNKYDDLRGKYVAAQSEEEAAFYRGEMLHNYRLRENAGEARDAYLIATAVPALYVLIENFLLDRGGTLMIARGGETTFRLRPVSMPSAMLRGILFPGMGHVYSGQRGMGSVWSVSILSAVGAALVADGHFRGSQLDYDEAVARYAGADSEEGVALARRELEDSFSSMEGAHQLRGVLRGVALGLWVVSVLDAGRVATISTGESLPSGGRSLSMDVYGVPNGLRIGLRVPLE